MDRVVALPWELGWALTRRAPEPVARAVFGLAADLAWRRRGDGVRRLERNLTRACPGLDEAGLRALSRRAMRSYLRYWREVFRLPAWTDEQIAGAVVIEGEHILHDAFARDAGVVMALPHTANWDLAGAWVARAFVPLTTVAERLRPERLFGRFADYRRRLGIEVLPLTGAGQSAFSVLLRRARAGGLVCLVADRDLSATGVTVDLLGEPAMLPAGPAMLARSAGAALLPITSSYDGALMRIRVHEPVPPAPGRDGLRQMTQRVADAFTEGIRAHPADWHMLQRVFVADRRP
ncbi:MAG TPA: phosphatidylinositol mannoside acyltransferase [Nocardioidaceae bacterium]|nr:phosphatidylinositol mannoside acyltransferase [Nocardioidaceae bacterium]